MLRSFNFGINISVVLTFVIIVCNQSDSLACDECQKPSVVTFDCKVVPPRPSDTSDTHLAEKIIAWRDLFWAAAGIKTWVFNSDPTKDCFTHLDGAFFTQGDTASKGIKFGDEWANLPPANAAAGGDYLITGSVDGTDGAYSVTAELQVSKTREVVSSATVSFSASIGSLDAGKSAAQALGPVVDKIRAFEKSKRETGHPYALQPTAELHPQKFVVKKGESVEVELWLYDCDGTINSSPLANRPVQLTAIGGTLSQQTVTTGSDGKAVVTFTAGNEPVEALLQATYPFKLASEYESVSKGGSASIKITQVPSTLWTVSGKIHRRTEYEESQTTSITGASGASWQRSYTQDDFRVHAVIRNISEDTLVVFQSDSVPLTVQISGMHVESELDNSYTVFTKGWMKDQSNSTVVCLPVKSTQTAEDVYFSFFYSPFTNKTESHRTFSITGWDMKGQAINRGQSCDSENGCTDDNGDSDAEGPIEVYIGGIESDTGNFKDTAYTDALSGDSWKTSEIEWIKKVDGSFLLHRYCSQTVVSRLSGGAHDLQSTSTSETLYDFLITPLDKKQNTDIGFLSPFSRQSTGFDAQVLLRGTNADIQYTAPAKGVISVKLYAANGKLLLSKFVAASAGNNCQQITSHAIYPNGILIANVILKSDAGKEYKKTMMLNSLRAAVKR